MLLGQESGLSKLSVPLRSTTDGVVVTVGYDAINRTWIGQQLSSIFAFKLVITANRSAVVHYA